MVRDEGEKIGDFGFFFFQRGSSILSMCSPQEKPGAEPELRTQIVDLHVKIYIYGTAKDDNGALSASDR